jgi:hypothetical protein
MRLIAAIVTFLSVANAAPTAQAEGFATPVLKKFIVGLKSGSEVWQLRLQAPGSRFANVKPTHQYNVGRWKGFAALLSEEEWLALRNDSRVSVFDSQSLRQLTRVSGSIRRR